MRHPYWNENSLSERKKLYRMRGIQSRWLFNKIYRSTVEITVVCIGYIQEAGHDLKKPSLTG